MVNLHRIKDFLLYSVIGLAFSACPVLAQGQKVVELDQESKVAEIVVLVGSGLIIILTLILFVLTARASISGEPSTLDPVIVISFFGLVITASSSLIIGALTHNLILAITVQVGIFLGILLLRLRVALADK